MPAQQYLWSGAPPASASGIVAKTKQQVEIRKRACCTHCTRRLYVWVCVCRAGTSGDRTRVCSALFCETFEPQLVPACSHPVCAAMPRRVHVSPEQIRDFHRDGFVHVRGVLPETTLLPVQRMYEGKVEKKARDWLGRGLYVHALCSNLQLILIIPLLFQLLRMIIY